LTRRNVLAPKVIDRTDVVFDVNEVVAISKPLELNEPLPTIRNAGLLKLSADLSEIEPPDTCTLNVSVRLFVSRVLLVPFKTRPVAPAAVTTRFETGNSTFPETVRFKAPPASVMVPTTSRTIRSSAKIATLVSVLTVNEFVPVLEFLSKKTLSEAVGTEAPAVPPEDADQLVVLVEFHVPDPPTQ